MLVDDEILSDIVTLADIKKSDRILEIGAGTGVLTQELAKRASIVAFEVDEQFKSDLKIKNVKVIWADAIQFFRKSPRLKGDQRFRKHVSNELKIDNVKINKIVSNLPYHICEPLLYCLFYEYDFEIAILTVPKTFAEYLINNPVAKAMLDTEISMDVPRSAFDPMPRTDSAVVSLKPRKEFDNAAYVIRCLYLLRNMKLKNALREALIDLYSKEGRTLTKRKAKSMLGAFGFSEDELKTDVHSLSPKTYELITERISCMS